MNRDELRGRPAAGPPEVREAGDRKLVMPVDPVSDGTWIAVNDAGLVLALLNLHDGPAAPGEPLPPLSRGVIIPRLARASTVAGALREAAGLRETDYQPFRLVLADFEDLAVVTSVAKGAPVRERRPDGPVLFTSSGLGDSVVDAPRRALFRELVAEGGAAPEVQDAFHRHSWAEKPEISVCMRRAEACTVSLTTVDVTRGQVVLRYFPAPPDEDPPPLGVTIGIYLRKT